MRLRLGLMVRRISGRLSMSSLMLSINTTTNPTTNITTNITTTTIIRTKDTDETVIKAVHLPRLDTRYEH